MSTARRLILSAVLLPAALSASGQGTARWRDSLDVINRQIATSVYSSDLHLRKAAVNIELGQWEYAVDEYGLVLSREPGNVAALFYRAYANTRLRRYDLARSDYESVLLRVPRNMEARLGLAHVFIKLKRSGDAMDQMNTVVEQNPDSAVAYAARAGLETELKAYDAALYDWTEAGRLDPSNKDYIISRADILIRLGKKAEARRALDGAARLGVPQGALREWYAKCR